MKKVLVIGSAVVDVIIHLDHLPSKSEDVHVITQEMRMGGCGYNAFDMIRHFKVPHIPFFPIGTGAYGDFVRSRFQEKNIPTPIPTPDADNGCCYCFVEQDGERTFISYHGAEYRFQPEWFSLLDQNEIGSIYVCGLEIEETTGTHIISFLEDIHISHPDTKIYFAPGPRICRIEQDKMDRLLALSPVLHLNDDEAKEYTGLDNIHDAGQKLHGLTHNDVLITLGKDGCVCIGAGYEITAAGCEAHQIDTIGAGDSHIGTIIACRHLGHSMEQSMRIANRVSAKVVETSGALLSDDQFDSLHIFS